MPIPKSFLILLSVVCLLPNIVTACDKQLFICTNKSDGLVRSYEVNFDDETVTDNIDGRSFYAEITEAEIKWIHTFADKSKRHNIRCVIDRHIGQLRMVPGGSSRMSVLECEVAKKRKF